MDGVTVGKFALTSRHSSRTTMGAHSTLPQSKGFFYVFVIIRKGVGPPWGAKAPPPNESYNIGSGARNATKRASAI